MMPSTNSPTSAMASCHNFSIGERIAPLVLPVQVSSVPSVPRSRTSLNPSPLKSPTPAIWRSVLRGWEAIALLSAKLPSA